MAPKNCLCLAVEIPMVRTRERWEAAHTQPKYRPRYPHEEVVRWAITQLDTAHPSKTKVLDLGCGAGRHAIFLASEGFHVWACDFSQTGIAHVRKLAREKGLRIETHRCPAQNLGRFDSSTFDAVLCFRVLYYISLADARKAVREVLRILKPSGKFFCVLMTDRDSRRDNAVKIGQNLWRTHFQKSSSVENSDNSMDLLFFTAEDVSALFEDFEDICIDRMTIERQGFSDDDWLVYARKASGNGESLQMTDRIRKVSEVGQ
jgi:ubiquinone/menaquinone biosynthesis C-methylase UbiE